MHDPHPFGAQVAAHGGEDAGIVGLFRRGAGHNPHDFGQCATRCLTQILEAAGSSLAKVVRSGVFLKNMNDFAAMNEAYGKYFTSSPPARTTVEVARLPKDVLVEIDVIALE